MGYLRMDDLHSYVIKMAKKIMNENPSDTVYEGTVVESLVGYYNIKLNKSGSIIKATPLTDKLTFARDDYVYLVAATTNTEGGQKTDYFIVGLVSATKDSFELASIADRWQADESAIKSWCTDIGGDNDENRILFKTEETNLKFEENDYLKIVTSIKQNGFFSISGIFNTFGAKNLDNVKNFGIKVSLIKSDEETVIKSYNLDIGYFSGQPFNLKSQKQFRIVSLSANEIQELRNIKVSVFLETIDSNIDFLVDDNFWVKTIELQGGRVLDNREDFKAKLEITNGKTYFFNNTDTGSIDFSATLEYKGQPLFSDSINYYWLIKKEGEKNEITEPGWKILNDSSYAIVFENGDVVENKDIILWDAKSDTFKLKQDKTTDYENILKCIIKYGDFFIESELIYIYNFEYEKYEAKLEVSGQTTLINDTDVAKIECIVTNDNKMKASATTTEYKYKWFIKDGENDFSQDNGLSSNIISIRDSGDEPSDETEKYEIIHKENNYAKIEIYCEVYLKGSDDKLLLVAETEPISIESRVGADFVTNTYYKYYIAEAAEGETEDVKNLANVRFTSFKNEKDNYIDWNIDGDGEKKWILLDIINNDAYNKLAYDSDYIEASSLDNNKCYYVYYTRQRRILDAHSKEIVSYENWEDPVIIRNISYNGKYVVNLQDEAQILQINTFNSLTNKGKTQGIFYTGTNYEEASGTAREGVEYYERKYNYVARAIKPNLDALGQYYVIKGTGNDKQYIQITDENKDQYLDGEDFKKNIFYAVKDPSDQTKYLNLTIVSSFNDGKTYYEYKQIAPWIIIYIWEEKDSPPSDDSTEIGYIRSDAFFQKVELEVGTSLSGYYTKNDNDLYINATFIKTGTLLVGENENNCSFYANFSKEESKRKVKIGGFVVYTDKFMSENNVNDVDHSLQDITINRNGEIRIEKKPNSDGTFSKNIQTIIGSPAGGGVKVKKSDSVGSSVDLSYSGLRVYNGQTQELMHIGTKERAYGLFSGMNSTTGLINEASPSLWGKWGVHGFPFAKTLVLKVSIGSSGINDIVFNSALSSMVSTESKTEEKTNVNYVAITIKKNVNIVYPDGSFYSSYLEGFQSRYCSLLEEDLSKLSYGGNNQNIWLDNDTITLAIWPNTLPTDTSVTWTDTIVIWFY